MRDLAAQIGNTRTVLAELMASCQHPSTHAACDHWDAAEVCDVCGVVVGSGILSFREFV